MGIYEKEQTSTSVQKKSTGGTKSTAINLSVKQRKRKKVPQSSPNGGKLAWEIFKPIALGGIVSLVPGALKLSTVGQKYKNTIDVVSKLRGSYAKISKFQKKIEKLRTSEEDESHEFKLDSLAQVKKHFESIPNALEINAENLINDASKIMTLEFLTDTPKAIASLDEYILIIRELNKLNTPYSTISKKLTEISSRIGASSKALYILERELEKMVSVALFPSLQAFLFSQAQTVKAYRSDVGNILGIVKGKNQGYKKALESRKLMKSYLNGTSKRKELDDSYRKPKNSESLARIKSALPALKNSSEIMYQEILPYCSLEDILDSLDFLEITDSEGFFALTTALKTAFCNEMASVIDRKESRYVAGLNLYAKLNTTRTRLKKVESKYNPMVMPFVYQEYFSWIEDSRSLLSSSKFTYTGRIKQMENKSDVVYLAVLSSISIKGE